MMANPESKLCDQCGVMYETARGHDNCHAKSRTVAYCHFCCQEIVNVIFHPDYKQPHVKTLCHKMICEKCEYAAFKLLWDHRHDRK